MSQQQKSRGPKLLIAGSIFVILVVFLLALFTPGMSRPYESDVFVMMQPFDNSVLEPNFEKQMKKAFPGISRLYFQKTSRIANGPNSKTTTNSEVAIQIVAMGKNADDAIRNANEIAPQFCIAAERLLTNANFSILNAAVGASDNRSRSWASSFRLGVRRDFEPTKISGTVNFVEANVLLSPDAEWEQHYTAGSRNPLRLIRRGSQGEHFILTGLFPTNQTDIAARAADRFEELTTIGSRIDALQKDNFTANSGLFLTRVSYCQSDFPQGKLLRSKHSEYYTTNTIGQIVQIVHIAIPADVTNGVHQMILRTLRLK